jgi:4-amino-4-deoxy-L-arabinose transferase-like glycosyltransferase
LAVVAVTLVLRLVVGSLVHLTEDEAYYRLWSMSPAFGYYDHPPMIAWWIWLGRTALGDNPLGVRLGSILASAATSFLVFDAARLAGAERATAARAAIWFNATLLVLAGGFLAVPDAPASLFWMLTVWCALKAKGPDRGSALGWWAAAGVAAGLATLSKYSALFIAPGMLLWLSTSADGRPQLRKPGPWLAVAIAATLFSLNLAWNAGHDWLTFAKQFGRVTPHALAPRYLLELVLSQALLLTPLIAVFAVAAFFEPGRTKTAGLAPFAAAGAPFALYLVIHSLHDRVQAHWPAPLYPLAAVCAATAAETLSERKTWRRLAMAAPLVGFAFGATALAVVAMPGGTFGRYDAALPVRGWGPFASGIERLRASAGATWVGTTSYGLAAELADEPAIKAPVVQIAERDRWRSLALTGHPDTRQRGLVIDLARRVDQASLGACFTELEPLGTLVRGDPGEPGKTYAVFIVGGARRDILGLGC